MRNIFRIYGTAFLLGVIWASTLQGELRLPALITDHMVLQRGKPIHLRGWAEPGEKITVGIAENRDDAVADGFGRWSATLPAMDAGGPYELEIVGRNEEITRNDVLVGDVWVGSGQSNMYWKLRQSEDGATAIANSDIPGLRLFSVDKNASRYPVGDVVGHWSRSNPETTPEFSAVAFYFGREIHLEIGVPVGLIHSSWGGTRVEPWTPPSAYPEGEARDGFLSPIDEGIGVYEELMHAYGSVMLKWEKERAHALIEGNQPPAQPGRPTLRRVNTHLYNGMIHPLIPFPISGAIWYQGEANRNDRLAYAEKFQALIRGWRNVWKQGNFPFYFVQLAPFNYSQIPRVNTPSPLTLPLIWEAQESALALPNTGMVTITDVGNLDNIHPVNKETVGHRLSQLALAKTYGRAGLVIYGPRYKSHRVEEGRMHILFEETGGGLESRDVEELSWFEIAGPDRRFYPANAKIDGNEVVVMSEKVESPVAVRFGFHESAEPNFVNREGLPTVPFRTDNWEIPQK